MCVSGPGSTVWHVCVAVCSGAGSVSVDAQRGAEREDGAGGEERVSACDLSCRCSLNSTSVSPQLGAGVSLPGVVAARCGAQVILSDSADSPLCLENCRRSCEANGLPDVQVLGLTWGDVSPDLVLLPELDFILGSDVFYEPRGRVRHNKLIRDYNLNRHTNHTRAVFNRQSDFFNVLIYLWITDNNLILSTPC